MEATIDYQSQQGFNPETKRPAPSPVDAELGSELSARRDQAGAEALWHEESAARYRAVERACSAAIEQLGPQDAPSPVRY